MSFRVYNKVARQINRKSRILENLVAVIEGCKKQEHRHQKMIYAHYYGYALKIVFRYIYRYEEAVLVVNDGFVKVFRNMEKFSPEPQIPVEQALMGWMRRIMINVAIDALRKDNLVPEIGGIPDYVWEEPDNTQAADQRLLYKELITCIKNLAPLHRIVFNLYVIDGYSHNEIAVLLNIAPGTSKSNLFRARSILQKHIKVQEEVKAWSL